MGLLAATRCVLSIKTNVAIILASAGGYYFLSGVQTFGVEFVTKQYGIAQALSTLVLLVIGAAGVLGVLAGGALGDSPCTGVISTAGSSSARSPPPSR